MTTIAHLDPDVVDGAHVAAAAFLARYSGRTLDAYRHWKYPGLTDGVGVVIMPRGRSRNRRG